MSQPPRHRSVALLLSLVPGWGHVYLGREWLGLAIFTVIAALGFGWLNGLLVWQAAGRGWLLWIAGSLGTAAVLGSWCDIVLRTSPRRRRRAEEARGHLLRQGTVAYLRRDLESAEVDFRGCLRIDPQDVEALFRLGVVLARRGERREARRVLLRARRADLVEKWWWEVEREIGALESAAPAAPPETGDEPTAPVSPDGGEGEPAGGREDARAPAAREAAG